MSHNNDDANRIRPAKDHPAYWRYKGEGVLLLGGSVEDNLFQIPDLQEHLDLLKSVGGNYVRGTMSSRDEGNVWPFEADAETGLYDLNKPGREFWRRFARFLELTHQRDIIVQVEVWATFDYYRGFWAANPFNPANNVNYTAEETALPLEQDTHPCEVQSSFFRTTPQEDNQQIVLRYQEAFVDTLLSHTLGYGHVLYCMDNETAVNAPWGAYWSTYIKNKANQAGLTVETTEMWDPWDLSDPAHANTTDHPETYSFIDISQNNHQKAQAHWDNMQAQRRHLRAAGLLRPMNNVKIYGADAWRFGTDIDGQERFWRNIFGGCASARFHRPVSGQGLNERAQSHIKSLRMLTDAMSWFAGDPHNDLLSDRTDNAAYCFANPGIEYAVFFTDGGAVSLDVSGPDAAEGWSARWLDIMASEWRDPQPVDVSAPLGLTAPGEGFWGVLVWRDN